MYTVSLSEAQLSDQLMEAGQEFLQFGRQLTTIGKSVSTEKTAHELHPFLLIPLPSVEAKDRNGIDGFMSHDTLSDIGTVNSLAEEVIDELFPVEAFIIFSCREKDTTIIVGDGLGDRDGETFSQIALAALAEDPQVFKFEAKEIGELSDSRAEALEVVRHKPEFVVSVATHIAHLANPTDQRS